MTAEGLSFLVQWARYCERHNPASPAAEEAHKALLALSDSWFVDIFTLPLGNPKGDALRAAWRVLDEELYRRPPPRLDPDARLAHLSAVCARRIRGWVCFYADRADARGRRAACGAEPLEGLLEALEQAQALIDQGEGDDVIDGAFEAVREAVDQAREAADRAPGFDLHDARAREQAIELAEAPLRTMVGAWAEVDRIRRDVRDGLADGMAAVADAATLVALDVPACLLTAEAGQ